MSCSECSHCKAASVTSVSFNKEDSSKALTQHLFVSLVQQPGYGAAILHPADFATLFNSEGFKNIYDECTVSMNGGLPDNPTSLFVGTAWGVALYVGPVLRGTMRCIPR